MDNWFKKRWVVLVISFVFAILLFVVVQIKENDNSDDLRFFGGSTETEKVENVPVNIHIDEKKYVVSGVPKTVTVTLEGSTSVLKATALQRNFDVYVDLQGIGEGKHTVDLESSDVPKGLKVYIEPKQVDVNIEKRSTKEFPVNVDFINKDKLPPGYELGDYEVKPKTVKVTSSEGVINQIGIVKVYMDVSGLKESINNREVPVNVYDSQGNELNVRVEPVNAVVSVEVNHPSKKVPVKVVTKGDPPKGYTLTSAKPKLDEVEIFGNSDTLDGIKEITTEVIDLSKIKETGTIDVSLALPDGVVAPDVKKLPVELELEQKKSLKDIPISIDNVKDGQEVSFLKPDKPVMHVEVSGKQKDVAELTADDVTVSVDVSGLDIGKHEVPVTVNGPEANTYTSEFQQVTIDIS